MSDKFWANHGSIMQRSQLVEKLALNMHGKLRENAGKGHWEEHDVEWLIWRAIQEMFELLAATPETAWQEAADAASFIAFAADNITRGIYGKQSFEANRKREYPQPKTVIIEDPFAEPTFDGKPVRVGGRPNFADRNKTVVGEQAKEPTEAGSDLRRERDLAPFDPVSYVEKRIKRDSPDEAEARRMEVQETWHRHFGGKGGSVSPVATGIQPKPPQGGSALLPRPPDPGKDKK